MFDESRSKKIDIVLGYAERTTDGIGYNTCVSFSANEGKVISKYRKVHLPDTKDPFVDPHAINKREKRYFTPGNLGFPAFWAPGLISGTAKMSSAQCGENTVGKGDPIFGMISVTTGSGQRPGECTVSRELNWLCLASIREVTWLTCGVRSQ